MKEIYVSTDIECDGPCPGLNSMLSFASVALDPTKGIGREAIVDVFEANLETLPGAKTDPETMKWWGADERKEAWERCRFQLQKPADVLPKYAAWLAQLGGAPIFVGYPASFDFTFIYYYLHRFSPGNNPFVRNAIDVETYAMAMLGSGYLKAGEHAWPDHWFDRSLKVTHVALDDAMVTGFTFLRILNERVSKTFGAPLGAPQPCLVCMKPGGALMEGPHTYGAGCGRRKFG